MGSPTSFPILCVLNLALTRYALELAAQHWNPEPESGGRPVISLANVPILVNGDDIVFRANKLELLVWKDVTRMGGLIPSIGKNFTHGKYFTINSELWSARRRQDSHGNEFFLGRKEKTLEMGYIYGSMKAKTGAGDGSFLAYAPGSREGQLSRADCWKKFLASAEDQELAYDLLWETNYKKVIEGLPRGMPLCLPSWLGGAGFPLPPATHPKFAKRIPSHMQLLIARYLSDTYVDGNLCLVTKLESWNRDPSDIYYLKRYLADELEVRRRVGADIPRRSVEAVSRLDLSQLPFSSYFPFGLYDEEPQKGDRLTRHVMEVKRRRGMWDRLLTRLIKKAKKHGRGPIQLEDIPDRKPGLAWPEYSLDY
jgi:hypothetical protein